MFPKGCQSEWSNIFSLGGNESAQQHRRQSHAALVEKLAQIHLNSVYHHQTQELQGRESVSTFYLYRHADKGYHIDYAFVSQALLDTTHLSIPDAMLWLKRSDHIPLILDVKEG